MAPRGGSSKEPEINLDAKLGLAWASLREKISQGLNAIAAQSSLCKALIEQALIF